MSTRNDTDSALHRERAESLAALELAAKRWADANALWEKACDENATLAAQLAEALDTKVAFQGAADNAAALIAKAARAEKAEAALAEAHAALAEVTAVAQQRGAQIAALRAIETIKLDEAKRILDEVRTDENLLLACNRAITVATLAVNDLVKLKAAIGGAR